MSRLSTPGAAAAQTQSASVQQRLIRLAFQRPRTRTLLLLSIFLGAAGGVLIVFQAQSISCIISQAFLKQEGLAALTPDLLWLIGIFAARALVAFFSEGCAGSISIQVRETLRTGLFDHLLVLGPAYASGEHTGELAAAATSGIDTLEGFFSQYLPQLALAALIPLTILLVVFPLDLLSGAALLLTAPLIPLFMVLIGRMGEAATHQQWTSLTHLGAHFLDAIQGLTTLKAFGRSQSHARSVAHAAEDFRQATMAVLRITFLSALVLEWVATISTAVVAVEIGLRLLYGQLVYQDALFILVLAPDFYLPLRQLGLRFHAGKSGIDAARQILAVLDTPSPAPEPCNSLLQGSAPKEITFEAVHYTYPAGTAPMDDPSALEQVRRPALQGISFTIPAGQRLALVGPSGAGKSTLLQMLLGFIQPGTGRILVDGLPLTSISLAAWRQQIAWVPQRPSLFNDSLAANLCLGRPHASEQQMRAAARQAGLDEWIQTLPQGYQTRIGEGGARLSGGQAQRLALARAFLRSEATLVLLDEPAASLDPENEALLQHALEELGTTRTMVVIAHRLTTAMRASQVVVIHQGRVVDCGTHPELLARCRLYQQMVNAYAAQA